MPPTVSVNLCCYNSEKYLRETLDSIINQTYKDWELVVINDGSTDSTESIIKNYINEGYPIIYQYQQNKGLSYSRNKALELSKGHYIAFIDHDDVWIEDKISRQITAMSSGNYALCYGGVVYIDKNGREIGKRVQQSRSGCLFGQLLKHYDADVTTVMIRKDVLESNDLRFDERLITSEDYCLFMQIAVKNQIVVLPGVLSKYRIHDDSLTNKSISKWAEEWNYTLNLIKEINIGIDKLYKTEFKAAEAHVRYYQAKYFFFKGDRLGAIMEMRKNIFIDIKYFLLFILLFMPNYFWNYAHTLYTKRSRFS